MKLELRPHQVPASEWLSRTKRGLLICRAAGGKTLIAASALDAVIRRRARPEPVRIGWIAPTREILEQGRKAVATFPLVAAQMLQFACPHPGLSVADCDVVVVDEAKHAASPMLHGIVSQCQGARWGLDATPWGRDDEQNAALRSLFEQKVYEVPPEDVAPYLAPARVIMLSDTDPDLTPAIDAEVERITESRMNSFRWMRAKIFPQVAGRFLKEHKLPLPSSTGKQWEEDAWKTARSRNLGDALEQQIKEYLRKMLREQIIFQAITDVGFIQNRSRNDAIIRTCLRHATVSKLVLIGTVEWGTVLADRVPGAVVLHSKMKQRKTTMEAVRTGAILTAFATSLADEGLDIPRLQVVVMGAGGRSKGKTEQRAGRCQRLFTNKTEGLIYDFEDTFHPTAARHSKVRQSVYRKLNFRFDGALL